LGNRAPRPERLRGLWIRERRDDPGALCRGQGNAADRLESLDILIWGGVATPEAASAFLATGAAGIVFESVHWLTDLVAIDDEHRQRLSSLRLDSTDLVGLDLQVPCRLFQQRQLSGLQGDQGVRELAVRRRDHGGKPPCLRKPDTGQGPPPLASHFSQDEVIPLGVEATFAASFVERFGVGTEEAVQAFMDEIRRACGLAEMKKDAWLDSPVAKEMGTLYPLSRGHVLDHRGPGVCRHGCGCRGPAHHRPWPDGRGGP